MYYILTDGVEIWSSATFVGDELERANARAFAATDGNVWWEAGSEANVDRPKSESYRHIKREDLADAL